MTSLTPQQQMEVGQLGAQFGLTPEQIGLKKIEQTTAVAVAKPTGPEPLTEVEAIDIVKHWVAEDEAQFEFPERRTVEELIEALQDAGRHRTTTLTEDQIKEIVSTYAPNAPRRKDIAQKPVARSIKPRPTYPEELAHYIEKGIVFLEDNTWLTNRCPKCGQFEAECCGPVTVVSVVRDDEKTLNFFGRQLVGLDPIKRPKPPKTLEEIRQEQLQKIHENPWWKSFRSIDELEGNGTVKMYVENFLPEGVTLICGLPKEGKSWLALSVAKALTSGLPLFGKPGFEVPEPVPVLYLAAESGDGALKLRCERMGITKDKTRFICRTLSQGLMLGLDDPDIEAVIKALRPIVILETLVRFNDGDDEDDAMENRKLAQAIFRLIALGARAVLGIHHSRKDLNKANPTKEAAVRGSGDGLAMVDAVWVVMQDERLYQFGKGPNEVDVVGWGRDFSPRPMRLALTKKAPKDLPDTVVTYAPGMVSCIDAGDFEWVDRRENRAKEFNQLVEELVKEFPAITLEQLAEKTDQKPWAVRKALKQLGFQRGQGGDTTKTLWTKKVA